MLVRARGFATHVASGSCPYEPQRCFDQLTANGAGFLTGPLRADAFDILDKSGLCDPIQHLDDDVADLLADPVALFTRADDSLRRFPRIAAADMPEYARMVVRQVLSGKVELRTSILGGGAVLARTKPASAKLRKVWHGARVSDAAAPPLPPPSLLNLEALDVFFA